MKNVRVSAVIQEPVEQIKFELIRVTPEIMMKGSVKPETAAGAFLHETDGSCVPQCGPDCLPACSPNPDD